MPRVRQIKTFDTFLTKSGRRILVPYGGAGSGKSVSVGQHILQKFLREHNKRFLITRKTLPSLKITSWYLLTSKLREWGVPVEINRSEMIIRFGDNEILAKSLDDPEKIKSFEANYIWIEEATELTREDFMQLNLRLRRENPDGINQMWLTFNPIDQFHWCITDLVQSPRAGPGGDIAVHHSTYKDNPFLPPEYIRELESLINQDENYYRIYTLGEPGVLENVIYKNYATAPFTVPFQGRDDVFYGLDFGFNNPSCLMECYLNDGQPMVRERIYESHLTNADLIDRANSLKISKEAPMYCDAAEPDRIKEWQDAGYNAIAADKSVKDGIDYVKRNRLLIDPESTNTLAEIRGYSYRKKGDQVLDEPVKFRDHAMDAVRYALYTHAKLYGGDTIPILISGGFGKAQQEENRRRL